LRKQSPPQVTPIEGNNPQSPAWQSGKPLNFPIFAQISDHLLFCGYAANLIGVGDIGFSTKSKNQ
jgi:hypothetical protein